MTQKTINWDTTELIPHRHDWDRICNHELNTKKEK